MNKKIAFNFLLFSFVFLPLFAPVFTVAQNNTPSDGGPSVTTTGSAPAIVPIPNPFKGGNTLSDIIKAVLNNIIEPIAAVYVVVMIIYSGFKYITAQGNPGKIKEANQGLLYVLIGALILLGAAAISSAICGTLSQLISSASCS